MPSAALASRTRKWLRRRAVRASAAATPVIAARSGSRGSKYGSGWSTRMSATPRHSLGVRSRVQTTIEITSRVSPALNQIERKMLKTDSRSRISTIAAPMTGS